MVRIGYKLSSEEFGPNELVRNAEMAESSTPRAACVSEPA
jgi:hypothetical protein